MRYIFILAISLQFLGCSDEPSKLVETDLIDASISANDLSLTLVSDSLPADGKSTTKIALKVGTNFLATITNQRNAQKDVTFTISSISSSSAVGSFEDNTRSLTQSLDAKGEAFAVVKSSVAGFATVKASINTRVGDITKSVLVKFYTPKTPGTTVVVEKDNVPADNASYAIIRVTSQSPDVTQNVVFTTANGQFSNNSLTITVPVSPDGITRAYLKYGKPGLITVTSSIASTTYSKQLGIQFTTAYPEQILIEPTSSIVSNPQSNTRIQIKARLIRTNGTASEGQTVLFYDSTGTNKPAGYFINTTKSDASEVTTDYLIQDTDFKGFVYIKGYLIDSTGRKIEGKNHILIK